MPLPDPEELKRKDKVDQLLSRANYHRIRQEFDQMDQICRQILELDPDNALAMEWVTDAIYERGDLQTAAAEYKKLVEAGISKDSAETKYAKIMLELAEQERQKALVQEMLDNPAKFARPERSPLIALLLSLVAPGFGHLYLGELIKGGIILGVTFISYIALALSPGTGELLRQFLMLLSLGYGSDIGSPKQPIDFFSILFSGILLFTYIYAVIDAPLIATKTVLAKQKEKAEKD